MTDYVNWIISVINIPHAKSLWVVVVVVDMELEDEIVNWVELRKG